VPPFGGGGIKIFGKVLRPIKPHVWPPRYLKIAWVWDKFAWNYMPDERVHNMERPFLNPRRLKANTL